MKGATRVVVSGRDERTLWRRMENTPLRDLLMFRGFSGRLDIDWVTRSAGLPERSAAIVKEVVKRTRLWTGERLDTAHELTAHFRDGLDAGRNEDELVASFGDVKQAAELIKRATKRKRPLVWHVWRRGWQAVGCVLGVMLLVLGWSMARYWTATPTITRNYTAELNAKILAVPESERAWPLYREAILMMGEVGPEPTFLDESGRRREVAPTDAEWSEMLAYAGRLSPAIELVVRGAERRELGTPLQGHVEPDLEKAFRAIMNTTDMATEPNPWAQEENPPLIRVLLPYMNPLRKMGMLLCNVVAVEATRTRDAAVFERSVSAVVGMAGQFTQRGTIIEQLVGQALLNLACETIRNAVRDQPTLLDERTLGRISHRLAAVDLSLKLDGERLMMHDMVQRVYSDDGTGDGIVTYAGMRTAAKELSPAISSAGSAFWGYEPDFMPAAPLAAGRKETVARWDAYYDRVLVAARADNWYDASRSLDVEVELLHRNNVTSVRFPMLMWLMPALSNAVSSGHISAMWRDGVCIGLALEIHKRRHGSYPEALTELVPAMLPAVPKDCYDGAALRYRVKEGRPEVYSVWRDGKDDGGVFEKPAPGIDEPDMRLWGW